MTTDTGKSPIVFAPLKDRRVFEEICDRIREELDVGTLAPGDKLPAERELVKQFGTGRPAVREALRSLEVVGIIELRRGKKGGAFIRDGDPALVTGMMQDMISLGRVSLKSLTEARILIQETVVKLAATRATNEDFELMERNIQLAEQLTAAGQYKERLRAFADFYIILCRATHNEVLSFVIDALTGVTSSVMARVMPQPRMDAVAFQRELLELLRARNGEKASILMTEHLKILHRHLARWEQRRRLDKDLPTASSFPTVGPQTDASSKVVLSAAAETAPRKTSRIRARSRGGKSPRQAT